MSKYYLTTIIIAVATATAFGQQSVTRPVRFNSFDSYHLADSAFTYRSLFAPYNPQIGGGIVYDLNTYPNRYMKRALGWNTNVVQLFWLAAFPKLGYAPAHPYYPRIEVHTKDSIRFYPEKSKGIRHSNPKQWSEKNLFCYELILPQPVPDTLFSSYMLADLQRNFNITAWIEKREQPCMVLTRSNTTTFPHSTKKQFSFEIGDHTLSATGITIDQFIETLYSYWDIKPIINETRIDYPVDIIIPFEKGLNPAIVMDYLKTSGFELKEETRPLNKLVLYDRDNPPQ
ncbi:MAG: hypothetical protein JSU01_02110 [Bacteroidetes bacterium]|nr:hypothetical protein [Bacteroidota bacterium]